MVETKTFKTCYRPLSTHWDWTRVRHWLPLATGTRGTYYQQLTQQPLGTHVHVFIYLFIYLLFVCLFIYLFIYLFSSEQARLYELRSLEDQWIETESNKIIKLPTPVSICTCIMYCTSVYIVCTCIMYCTSVYVHVHSVYTNFSEFIP